MTLAARGGALVTGGAKRVGRALSLALAGAGYHVAIHHRGDAADAEALAREIAAAGGQASAVSGDLSAPEQMGALVGSARAKVGPLTLLVNNASHFEGDSIQTLTLKSWEEHMGPNLLAPILLIQAFAAAAEELAADADASVINILDQRVLRPNPLFFSYTLSKCALMTATQTLAQGLAPRIRVNAIGPGPTLPSVHQTPETFQAEVDGVLLKRKTELSDLADAALYLAGARTLTGQMIAVDGGQHLGWRTPDIVEGG